MGNALCCSNAILERSRKTKYLLQARNPKSGNVETYTTEIYPNDVPMILELWRNDAGYEILSFEPQE